MTIQEFLSENIVSQVEKTNQIILNLIVDGVSYGIDVDTSSIEVGTILTRTTDFQIDENFLICGDIVVDITTTNMLLF